MELLGLADLIQRQAAGISGRLEDLETRISTIENPVIKDIVQRYANGEISRDLALDELTMAGHGYSDNPWVNLGLSMVLDPFMLIGVVGGVAVQGARSGTRVIATAFTMRRLTSFAALVVLVSIAPSAPAGPFAHTFSIVARDPKTGELGVAVQSHWFSVGSIVTWAEAGVGAVATQSFVEPRYGPRGLALMKQGTAAPDVLKALVAQDAQRDVRQVAMIDAQGRVAAHTGRLAIAAAGHRVGTQYSVQANLMDSEKVWPAMAQAYERATGDLADRLLAALEAGQSAGGDIRGRQSAAILIVKADSMERPWAGADRPMVSACTPR